MKIHLNRRELLKRSAAFGLAIGLPHLLTARKCLASGEAPADSKGENGQNPENDLRPLVPPKAGSIPVAFVVSKGAVVIDFAGPWEVFTNVRTAQGEASFQLYTVAETLAPITAGVGLTVVPNYTFQTAPVPKVIVIPAQEGSSPAMLEWIRRSSEAADVTMSVCTGASVLAQTGLLNGKSATTHHGAYVEFAMDFPAVRLQRGARFVEDGNLASSGGLSSGIDLALRVVERYYGRQRAEQTADMMEYQGRGWLNPNSNEVYAKARVSTDEHPLCPVCSMEADRTLKSVYQGKSYYFCMQGHKELFDKTPEKFVILAVPQGSAM